MIKLAPLIDHVMKSLSTILLLVLSNIFMNFAWYGHLKFFAKDGSHNTALWLIILISWGLAFLSIVFKYLPTDWAFQATVAPSRLFSSRCYKR